MAIRVVTEDAPIIKITGVASAPVSSPIGAVNTVNVSQSNQVVKVPSVHPAAIEISPIGKAEVQVSNPVVRPFKAIIYQGPKGDPGIAASGSSVLTSDLIVTNPVGEADLGDVYYMSTDLEVLITDMLTLNNDPEVVITDVGFTESLSGTPIGSNKIEVNTPFSVQEIFLSTEFMENVYPQSNISFTVTNPVDGSNDLNLFPVLTQPSGGWEYFPSTTSLVPNPVNLTYSSLGKKKVSASYLIVTTPGNLYSAETRGFDYDFFVGKKIRCMTSVASDPEALNLGHGFSGSVNVYLDSSPIEVFGEDPNEVQFEDVITDFTSETQEIIVSLSSGTQSVSDKNRFLIFELPVEFSIDEASSATAGSGFYSLNDSIVYLGNQYPNGEPYLRNGIPVKYYRTSRPGMFNEKIKIDLQIKLDN